MTRDRSAEPGSAPAPCPGCEQLERRAFLRDAGILLASAVAALGAAPGVPAWVGWIEFLGSEVVAIGVLGYPLLKGVARATQRNPTLRTQNPS